MPADMWGHKPTVERHGSGWSIPVAVTQVTVGSGDETSTAWSGIRIDCSSLASADVAAAVAADPDATGDALTLAQAAALDASVSVVQPQLDNIITILLGD